MKTGVAKLHTRCVYGFVLVILSALMSTRFLVCQRESHHGSGIEVDSDVQGKIEKAVRMLTRHWHGESTKEDVALEIARLKRGSEQELGQTILQILAYRVAHIDEEEEMMASLMLLFQIRPEVSDETLLTTIAPYLSTTDAPLRKQLNHLLDSLCYNGDGENLARFMPFLKRTRDKPFPEVVTYLYEKSPEKALSTLMEVYGQTQADRNSVLQCSDLIRNDIHKRDYTPPPPSGRVPEVSEDAKECLTRMSKNEKWWVRAYVAAILEKRQEMRTPELVERIKEDKHPCVQRNLSPSLGGERKTGQR